jgi:UDP:flavonoid glycosyltransferase YjiC (YdhE family)
MKVLIATGPTYGLVFPLVPLAWALRAAGHEVMLTGPANASSSAVAAGMPFTAATGPLDMMSAIMTVNRQGKPVPFPDGEEAIFGYMGQGFGRLAAYMVDGLEALSALWRPDIVVGSTYHFAPALLAERLGIPFVKQTVELGRFPLMLKAAQEELAPELDAAGLSGIPGPDLLLETCPPSLRQPDPGDQLMRYVPYNTPSEVESWILKRDSRPRVCVTLGSRVAAGRGLETLARLTADVAGLGTELLVAATEETAAMLQPLPEGVRAGWMPLDVLLPTCDLVVHHGGGNTTFSCMSAGTPQVMLTYMVNNRVSSRMLRDQPGAVVLEPGEDGPVQILRACEDLLADPAHAAAARDQAAEIAGMPGPADAVGAMERLVGVA